MRLYIPRDKEAQNILIAGTTGSRKTTILDGFAEQAMERGWPCIFTDLKCSFVEKYYRPEIDHIINFADARCSSIAWEREFTKPLEAQTLAHAVVKQEENSIPYFVHGTRDILGFLLGSKRETMRNIIQASRHPDDLEEALKGSDYQSLLQGSAEARAGFANNLSLSLNGIRLMPLEGNKELCIREWCLAGAKRKGRIFFSSSADNFEAQRQLQALMIDMLLAGMQKTPGPGCCIFDEIGVYGEIPTYEKALSIQRSSGNPIISAFQGFSQLRKNYGAERAKTITSNPFVKIVLAIDEPDEAK